MAATAVRLGIPLVSNDGIFANAPGLDVETARDRRAAAPSGSGADGGPRVRWRQRARSPIRARSAYPSDSKSGVFMYRQRRAGWARFGLVPTTALTTVMIAAQLAGLTHLDLPLLLGTTITEDPDKDMGSRAFIHRDPRSATTACLRPARLDGCQIEGNEARCHD